MIIQVPITTEVIEKNSDLQPSGKVEDNRIIIEMDTRQRDYHKQYNLKRKVKILWAKERTFDVQELSGFSWPIVYRVTTAEGYYSNGCGERVYFTPEVPGLSTRRKVSDVVLRLGIFLYVIVGIGSRKASWLMEVLFQVTVSKSALDRWVDEVADALPSSEEMVKLLHQQRPITQGHLDELFPLGGDACVLALKDEHGRIIVAQEVEKRDEEHVKPFLEGLKRLGLDLKAFYIDHWQAYFNAIRAVYPEAEIQYDYFHILQNIWRKVWGEFRLHRLDLKQRGEAAQTVWYAENLKRVAAELWKHRYIFFKAEDNLSAKERETMREVLSTQPEVSFMRGFLLKVWAIFEDSTTEADAQERLADLKRYALHHEKDGYSKSISFLDQHFKNMTTFLRVPAVQRNSLAESGMRVMRRLERNHDGFRTDKSRQNALKIYQAVSYLGWSIHNPPNLAPPGG
ncbi:MAG: transposase [Blastocatellales bacterium]|nr:transposase [Blastocatellales bacterium]